MSREPGPIVGLVIGGVIAVIVHGVLAVSLGIAYAIPTTLVGAIAGAVVLRGPLGAAIARRLQGGDGVELPPEQVLNELDDLRTRLAELEERADFSERLLARQRESETPGS